MLNGLVAAVIFAGLGATAILWLDQPYLGGGLIFLGAIAAFLKLSVIMMMWRIGIPALLAVLAALSLELIQHWPPIQTLSLALAEHEAGAGLLVEIFSGTTSTIYALLVAFMVFNAMQDHNDINATLEKEAMHLDSISQILPLLHDGTSSNRPAVRSILLLLREYAENVTSKAFTKTGSIARNQEVIDETLEQIYSLKLEDDNDRIALGALMRRVDELESLRAHRISAMKSKPSPFLILLLLFLSVLVIAPFFLPMPGLELLSRYGIGMVTFCTVFLFVMLTDMASHFHGYWVVDRGPFTRVHGRIQARLHKLDAGAPIAAT